MNISAHSEQLRGGQRGEGERQRHAERPPGQISSRLTLGSTVEGLSGLSAVLGVKNDAAAPADSLAGSFTTAATGYSLSGFSPFSGLAAGATQGGLTVTLPSTTAGTINGSITLTPQSTNPRPFSMTLPAVTINLTGRVFLAGDFQEDGDVDSNDLTNWRTGFGTAVGATHMQGNADGDGDVDGRDFLIWQRGGSPNPVVAAVSSSSAAVPEPAGSTMLMIGMFSLIQLCVRSATRAGER